MYIYLHIHTFMHTYTYIHVCVSEEVCCELLMCMLSTCLSYWFCVRQALDPDGTLEDVTCSGVRQMW